MPSVEGVDDNSPPRGFGVLGRSNTHVGVVGRSNNATGVYGESNNAAGVHGESNNRLGVSGYSESGTGVFGYSDTGHGVVGSTLDRGVAGVSGYSPDGYGVYGSSSTSYGVYGSSYEYPGVYGNSNRSLGVNGESFNGHGVRGYSVNGLGVFGDSIYDHGVYGNSDFGYGVYGRGYENYGVYASSNTGLAALLEGRVDMTSDVNMNGPVTITGPLTKPGGSFRIDHPLDPANKYLSHSFVESPDMKNVYDGVVVLDYKGEAVIELPDWFGALNKDFRYQLTAIGAPAPNLHISEEISDGVIIGYGNTSSNGCNNNRFKIAGGTPGMKVSWQVTGIRKDPWANAHRISVEEDKPAKERGYYYIYPELYGQPEEKGISRLLFPTDKEKENVMVVT
jgi:hypothetical protein